MANLDINVSSSTCRKCGMAFSRLKGYFPISYSELYKGVTYMPYCRKCIDEMFDNYMEECQDQKMAVRQMCRKLDLYWNEALYNSVELKSTTKSIMTNYIQRVNNVKVIGKGYDDTLREENALWVFPAHYSEIKPPEKDECCDENVTDEESIDIPEEVISFWGPGNSNKMYADLEQRYQYWKSHLPPGVDISDIGVQALLRQICSVEIEINRERAAGKQTDKLVNTLNTLLGGAMLKPTQKKEDVDSSMEKNPLGVWLYKYENERPLPEVDPEFKDVNKIRKYVSVWVRGHLAKLVGLKNSYSKMYEDEVNRYRVEKPEYDGEDDEVLISDVFDSGGEDYE